MLTRQFTNLVLRIVVISCAAIFAVGIAFQVTSAECRGDPVAFATVVESRQTWLGGCGVFMIASIVVFLGLLAFAAFVISVQINRSVLNIREALGALLLRVSPTVERIQNILPQSKV